MKFERLTVPDWQLPDLVGFNRRVHVYLDPIFARRWVRWVAWTAFGGLMLVALMWGYIAQTIPSSQSLLAYQAPLPTNIRGYDGTPVQTFARERRVELSYDEYPPVLVQAFVSAEDKTFFQHHGIDIPGTVKAVFNYALHVGRPGRVPGGSTITQQVAKYLLKDSSYNVGRKAREAILAFRLESTLSKRQILEIYLNSIPLGRNAYGVQAAARAYFEKDVNELTLPDALIKFRQGIGRLIRSKTDRGLITILDSRVLIKAYGREFLGSLPTEVYERLDRNSRESVFRPFP